MPSIVTSPSDGKVTFIKNAKKGLCFIAGRNFFTNFTPKQQTYRFVRRK